MVGDIPQRVLVVDDDAVDVKLIKRLLREWSAEIVVRAESTVAAAIEAGAAVRYDCVLLDFNLPDQTGLEFLRHFLTTNELQPWPVVMLSGSGEPEPIVSAVKLGAKDYLLKSKLQDEKMLRSRMIMAMTEWAVRDRIVLQGGSRQQVPGEERLSEEIRRVRTSYYTLLDKYHSVVTRGSESAVLNADLVNKLMEYERVISRMRREAHLPPVGRQQS